MSHKSTRLASNLKVLGMLQINLDTGITVVCMMTKMMAYGSLKMENIPDGGTTPKDPLLKESGKIECGRKNMAIIMALGLQTVPIKPSETS